MRNGLRASAAAALGVAALASGILGGAASATKTVTKHRPPKAHLCPALKVHGTTLGLAINRGSVSCGAAAGTMRAFLAGGGTEHGGRSAPEAQKYWKLSGGWTCTRATNGGNCFRGGSSYLNAREVIGTYALTAQKPRSK